MRKLALLAAAILVAMSAAAAAVMSNAPAKRAATAPQPVTISPLEIDRQVDTGSLQMQQFLGP